MRVCFQHLFGVPRRSRSIHAWFHGQRSRVVASVTDVWDKTRSAARCISVLLSVLLLLPTLALAQPPWERAASNLERSFTGPLARSLALVAIVIGGLLFMFGEGGSKRQIAGIAFGGGLALFATQFLAWLF